MLHVIVMLLWMAFVSIPSKPLSPAQLQSRHYFFLVHPSSGWIIVAVELLLIISVLRVLITRALRHSPFAPCLPHSSRGRSSRDSAFRGIGAEVGDLT
jgi:hypothetical protein